MTTKLTDAALFDELYKLFGLGTFTDEGSRAWAKWRTTQIVRIRSTREKRGVDVYDLMVTARWCRRQGIHIREHWELYVHIKPALREHREQKTEEKVRDLDTAIAEAMAVEAQIPDSVWFDRLVRASGKARGEVYAEWEMSHRSRGVGTAATAGN